MIHVGRWLAHVLFFFNNDSQLVLLCTYPVCLMLVFICIGTIIDIYYWVKSFEDVVVFLFWSPE